MRSSRFVLVLAVCVPLASVTVTSAATHRVPSEYATINAALDATSVGDSVLVAPGVYDQYQTRLLGDGYWYSSVAFLRGGVCLISESGASATTLRMDTFIVRPIVLRAFGEVGTALVDGFTVTGTAAGISGLSFTWGERCIVRGCVFEDLGTGGSGQTAVGAPVADLEVYGCRFENINGAVGSAINQTSGTLLLEDSEFVNCRNGAVRLQYDSDFTHATGLTMRRCRFVSNVQTHGGSAGVIVNTYSTVLIEDSWFEGNQTTGPSSAGGAISGGGSSFTTIRNNTFVGNTAELGHGGAIEVGGPNLAVTGNTFWANGIGRNQLEGGSSIFFGGSAELRNNVIAGSTGDEAVGVYMGTVQTSCNVFWANPMGNATFPLSATDLTGDPMFCDAEANTVSVSAGSPCIPGNGHPSCTELIGAWGAGCGVVSVEPWTWGHIKSAYRDAGRTP